MTRRHKLILLVIIVVASVLRLAGMFDDFWLDEIWSYEIAQRIGNPLDLLLVPVARSDNNHPLNTLWLWLLGPQPNWLVYRIPSLLAGIGSVLLVPRIMRRYGMQQTILATALVGLSFPLIFFSSEARGYSMAVFFALLALDTFERARPGPDFDKLSPGKDPAWPSTMLFWLSCVLGMLAHLSFVHVYLGLLALTIYRTSRAADRRVAAFAAIRLHLVPVVWIALLYAVFVRKITIGGAPEQPLWVGIGDALVRLIAMPGPVEFQIAFIAALLILFVGLLQSLRRRGSDLWVLLMVSVIVSPALTILRQAMILDHQQPMHARYFLVVLPPVLLAASIVIVDLFKRRAARWIASLALVGFFAVSLWQTFWFIRIGRGHYFAATLYMTEQTPAAVLFVESGHPLRTGMVLNFYARFVPFGIKVVPVDLSAPEPQRPPERPMWAISSNVVAGSPPAPMAQDPWGNQFAFDREFTYYGLSGYSWYLYRRQR
jgi:hypothetical protein